MLVSYSYQEEASICVSVLQLPGRGVNMCYCLTVTRMRRQYVLVSYSYQDEASICVSVLQLPG